jgi:adenylate kinase
VTSPALAGTAAQARDERRIIVMIGAPGAGKGTQAQRLAQELDLLHLSTGELFRDAVREQTPLGDQVRGYVEKGALVPDDLTIAMVEERLARPDATAGAILDGFPRTRAQAEALDASLARTGEAVSAALYVEVSPDSLIDRLAGRRVCSVDDQHVYHVVSNPPARAGVCDIDGAPLVQRRDDEPATIRRRLERQLPPMYEVIDHYADAGVLSAVQGDQPIDEVTADLRHCISSAGRAA